MADQGFVFFKSYADTFDDLNDEEAIAVFRAMLKFAFKEVRKEDILAELPAREMRIAFNGIWPGIDSSIKKREGGAKGGAAPKQASEASLQSMLTKQASEATSVSEQGKQKKRSEVKRSEKSINSNSCGGDAVTKARKTEKTTTTTTPTETADALRKIAQKYGLHLQHQQFEELCDFAGKLSLDAIEYAISDAAWSDNNGYPTWPYVRSILNRYVEQGLKSEADIKAAERRRGRGRGGLDPKNDTGDGINDDLFRNLPSFDPSVDYPEPAPAPEPAPTPAPEPDTDDQDDDDKCPF